MELNSKKIIQENIFSCFFTGVSVLPGGYFGSNASDIITFRTNAILTKINISTTGYDSTTNQSYTAQNIFNVANSGKNISNYLNAPVGNTIASLNICNQTGFASEINTEIFFAAGDTLRLTITTRLVSTIVNNFQLLAYTNFYFKYY